LSFAITARGSTNGEGQEEGEGDRKKERETALARACFAILWLLS